MQNLDQVKGWKRLPKEMQNLIHHQRCPSSTEAMGGGAAHSSSSSRDACHHEAKLKSRGIRTVAALTEADGYSQNCDTSDTKGEAWSVGRWHASP